MGFLGKLFGKGKDDAAATGHETDPVCGMKVDPAKAAGKSSHGGTYHFCSTSCKSKFDANPHAFLAEHSH